MFKKLKFTKPAWWAGLSPRVRRRVVWGAALLGFYTVFGFLILPLIVRSVAVKQISKQLDREVTIETVRINPYVLSGTIRGLLIKDKDGERFVAWREVYANFQLSSFFGRPWVFKEVRVVGPYARVQMNKDRTLNFSDLLKKFSSAPKPAEPSKPLALRVGSLRIVGAEASYTDLTPSEPFHRKMGPIELTLTGFHTDPENKNPYSFSGSTDSGETFSWSGHFFLDPLRSHGELTIHNVSIPQYAPIYQDFVKFDIRDGMVDLRGAYDVAWSATTNVATVTNASVRLRSFKLAEKGSATNVAEVTELRINGLSADAMARWAEVNTINVTGGHLLARRTPDAKVNVLELAQPAGTNISGSILFMLQSVTNAFAQLLTSTNAGRGVIREVHVRDCGVTFEDLANPRPVQLALTDVALSATNVSNLPGSNLTASASLRWNTNGAIRGFLGASLIPALAEVQFTLQDLELAPLGPYADQFVSVFIVGSRLNMDGQIHFAATNEAGPNATFQGNLFLDGFSSVDGDTGEDLLKFSNAKFSGINAQLNPPEFAAAELALTDLHASVVLETNQTLNLMRIARLDTTETSVTNVAATPAPVTGKKSFADLRKQFGSMARLFSATNLAAMQVPNKASLDRVVLSNAQIRLADRSVTPQVRLSLANVNGEVTGVSSDLRREIAAKLHTKVDQTGPVEITASMPPAGSAVTNRISVLVKDVDLNPAGPYSGKFLGYNLRKGKLNVQMDYHMTERKIRAQNVVVLDQLTLGEKVASPDATKLPVKLAVAILKDRNGQIKIDVPIEGDLDDPKFRLGKVITQTIVNVITKIVTSPFAALGSLFGGKGEDVRFQDFAAGSSELLPASAEKLDAIINGLYERPGLELEIQGSVDHEADRNALRRQKLEREFRVAKWNALRKSEKERTSPEQITLTPEEYALFIQKAHAEILRTQADADAKPRAAQPQRVFAAPAVSRTDSKGAEALIRKDTPAVLQTDQESEVLETVTVTDDDYRALATERAKQVKDYILKTERVEPERLFLTDLSGASITNKGSRVYLHLK